MVYGEEEGEERGQGKKKRRQWRNSCYLLANDLERGLATDTAAARAALSLRNSQLGRTQPGALGGSSSPCLGAGSSTPSSRTWSQTLPPSPPPTCRTGGRFAPSATTPVPYLPFLVSNGPGEPLRAKTKIYNLPSLAPPTLLKRETPRS